MKGGLIDFKIFDAKGGDKNNLLIFKQNKKQAFKSERTVNS